MVIEPFDFKHEARSAAVNEACMSESEASKCSLDDLCICCQALAIAIEHRLHRAYLAGVQSMTQTESGSE